MMMVVVMGIALNVMVVVYRLCRASLRQARLPSIHNRNGGGVLVVMMVMVVTTTSVRIKKWSIGGGLTGDELDGDDDDQGGERACCA